MAFGLPISVAIGWTLATPARRPAPVGATGGLGAGGIGAAPERSGNRQPVTTVQYSSRPARPGIISSAPPGVAPTMSATATPGATAPAPSAATSVPTLPPLTLPPVPTPTEITVAPSTSPSPSADDNPSGQPPVP